MFRAHTEVSAHPPASSPDSVPGHLRDLSPDSKVGTTALSRIDRSNVFPDDSAAEPLDGVRPADTRQLAAPQPSTTRPGGGTPLHEQPPSTAPPIKLPFAGVVSPPRAPAKPHQGDLVASSRSEAVDPAQTLARHNEPGTTDLDGPPIKPAAAKAPDTAEEVSLVPAGRWAMGNFLGGLARRPGDETRSSRRRGAAPAEQPATAPDSQSPAKQSAVPSDHAPATQTGGRGGMAGDGGSGRAPTDEQPGPEREGDGQAKPPAESPPLRPPEAIARVIGEPIAKELIAQRTVIDQWRDLQRRQNPFSATSREPDFSLIKNDKVARTLQTAAARPANAGPETSLEVLSFNDLHAGTALDELRGLIGSATTQIRDVERALRSLVSEPDTAWPIVKPETVLDYLTQLEDAARVLPSPATCQVVERVYDQIFKGLRRRVDQSRSMWRNGRRLDAVIPGLQQGLEDARELTGLAKEVRQAARNNYDRTQVLAHDWQVRETYTWMIMYDEARLDLANPANRQAVQSGQTHTTDGTLVADLLATEAYLTDRITTVDRELGQANRGYSQIPGHDVELKRLVGRPLTALAEARQTATVEAIAQPLAAAIGRGRIILRGGAELGRPDGKQRERESAQLSGRLRELSISVGGKARLLELTEVGILVALKHGRFTEFCQTVGRVQADNRADDEALQFVATQRAETAVRLLSDLNFDTTIGALLQKLANEFNHKALINSGLLTADQYAAIQAALEAALDGNYEDLPPDILNPPTPPASTLALSADEEADSEPPLPPPAPPEAAEPPPEPSPEPPPQSEAPADDRPPDLGLLDPDRQALIGMVDETVDWRLFPNDDSFAQLTDRMTRLMTARGIDPAEIHVNWDRLEHLVTLRDIHGGRIYCSDTPKLNTNEPYLVLELAIGSRTVAICECPVIGNATYVVDEGTAYGSWRELTQERKDVARFYGARAVHHPTEAAHLARIIRAVSILLLQPPKSS